MKGPGLQEPLREDAAITLVRLHIPFPCTFNSELKCVDEAWPLDSPGMKLSLSYPI